MLNLGVIPARYNSTRFKGKPLVEILGKPMIWWVYNEAKKSKALDDVVVLTDDVRVFQKCEELGMWVRMTSTKHETGLDRVTELFGEVEAQYYTVIFGDEPLITHEEIEIVARSVNYFGVSLGITPFKNPVDVINPTTVKVVLNSCNWILYMSRNPIPYPKDNIDFRYYKHVGVMSISRRNLSDFKKQGRTSLEHIEDIEQLRFLDIPIPVKGILIDTNAMSVDTPKDIKYVERILMGRSNKND